MYPLVSRFVFKMCPGAGTRELRVYVSDGS